jgi:hypothetical protein
MACAIMLHFGNTRPNSRQILVAKSAPEIRHGHYIQLFGWP